MNMRTVWSAEAAAMARYVADNMFEAHRGAMPWRQEKITVIFGNDGYGQDKRAKQEVALVREYLEEVGIRVLGFGTNPENNYSWAMLVQSQACDDLNKLVWACWMPTKPVREMMADDGSPTSTFAAVQGEIAARAILESSPVPRIELN